MAERPSVKDILAMARKGEANPAAATPPAPAAEDPRRPPRDGASEPVESEAEPAAPPAVAPAAAPLGRPMTPPRKSVAAARAPAGPRRPAAAAKAKAPASAAAPVEAASAEVEAAPAIEPAPAVPAPAPALGRPMTLKEKLAAARGAGATAPAAAGGAPPSPPPARARRGGWLPAKAAAARTLPPLEKMTDPRDLAEALRQTGAKKTKEVAAKAAAAAPPKAAPAAKSTHKDAKPQTVPPRPGKKAALEPALASAVAQAERRGFMIGALFFSFVALGWSAFTAASVALTTLCVRFMFPNVLAEPPSTIKIGLPTNFEKEDVNERFKAEWGFWVVRSTRYNGADILCAVKSVCTHLGCPPNWLAGEQKFKCPCHGSGFYISGINFEGPAPRPLERFKVSLSDDGQIMVDKSQIFQQELGQWEDPDSFIIV